MAEHQEQKIPIAILTGKGTRIGPTLQAAHDGKIPVEIITVATHRAIPKNPDQLEAAMPGIALSKQLGFQTDSFNLLQMTAEAEAVAKKNGEPFDPEDYRENKYFPVFGAFLKQRWPVKPVAVFMNGWDLVVPQSFIDYFPADNDFGHNVINFHPTGLARKFGGNTSTLPSGLVIPVIEGEETDVFKVALAQKLKAIGVTMHYAQEIPDAGGSVIEMAEVPIEPADTYDKLRARHTKIESEFMVNAIDGWARRELARRGVS